MVHVYDGFLLVDEQYKILHKGYDVDGFIGEGIKTYVGNQSQHSIERQDNFGWHD